MYPALLLALSLAACTTPSTATPPASTQAETRQLDVQALKAELEAGKVKLLLDVRTPAEFAAGHVPGAVNLPLDQLKPDSPLLGAPSGTDEVHVICQSGGRSQTASTKLAGWGYRPVNVQGGTGAWRAAGLPVE